MALNKAIELDTGVTLNYWRVTRINEDFNGNVEVYLGGYISDVARLACKNALEYKIFNFTARSLSRAGAYELIKESKLETKTTSEAIMDGETVITPAVIEEVETNIFADAVDC